MRARRPTKRNKAFGKTGRRGRRPLRHSIGKRCVGVGLLDDPPRACPDSHVIRRGDPCGRPPIAPLVALSEGPLPTSARPGFFRTHGRAHGPCPTKTVVGRDPCVPPPYRTPCKNYVIAGARRRGNPPLPSPQNFLKNFSFSLLTKAQNAIIMRLISNDKPVRKKSSTAQGILRELRVVRSKRCAAV